MLDDHTVAITDKINGRKKILYTFPLIDKKTYEKKKQEVLLKQIHEKDNKLRVNDYIVVNKSEINLMQYSTVNYIRKSNNESEREYARRISNLSDITYVLGNFRSFISETGLAANNYLWKEQLILA